MKRWIIGLDAQQVDVQVETELKTAMKQRDGLIVHDLGVRVIGILPVWVLISRTVDSPHSSVLRKTAALASICPPYHTFR